MSHLGRREVQHTHDPRSFGPPQLPQFPHELRDMGSLRVLDIASNELIRVGKTLGTLRQLEQLSLAENRIPALPPAIGKLLNLR